MCWDWLQPKSLPVQVLPPESFSCRACVISPRMHFGRHYVHHRFWLFCKMDNGWCCDKLWDKCALYCTLPCSNFTEGSFLYIWRLGCASFQAWDACYGLVNFRSSRIIEVAAICMRNDGVFRMVCDWMGHSKYTCHRPFLNHHDLRIWTSSLVYFNTVVLYK